MIRNCRFSDKDSSVVEVSFHIVVSAHLFKIYVLFWKQVWSIQRLNITHFVVGKNSMLV